MCVIVSLIDCEESESVRIRGGHRDVFFVGRTRREVRLCFSSESLKSLVIYMCLHLCANLMILVHGIKSVTRNNLCSRVFSCWDICRHLSLKTSIDAGRALSTNACAKLRRTHSSSSRRQQHCDVRRPICFVSASSASSASVHSAA